MCCYPQQERNLNNESGSVISCQPWWTCRSLDGILGKFDSISNLCVWSILFSRDVDVFGWSCIYIPAQIALEEMTLSFSLEPLQFWCCVVLLAPEFWPGNDKSMAIFIYMSGWEPDAVFIVVFFCCICGGGCVFGRCYQNCCSCRIVYRCRLLWPWLAASHQNMLMVSNLIVDGVCQLSSATSQVVLAI